MPFTFTRLDIPDVILVEPKVFKDDRGFFAETYKACDFKENGITLDFVQDNHSRSERGVLRGLHYQISQPQGKLVRAINGEIFDVAVDMRRDSPTFGRWVSAVLTAENHHALWVPPGFAHGFYVMSETADVIYSCTDYYSPQYERSLIWNDPEIGIVWPFAKNDAPDLSKKDAVGSLFADAECYA